MTYVSLLTAQDSGDPDEDLFPLQRSLQNVGVDARTVVWDQCNGSELEGLTLIRSTWDYHRKLNSFLSFTEHASRVGRLHNPHSVVNWNVHKFYLRHLQKLGIAIPTTQFLQPTERVDFEFFDASKRVVVKPAVSAGSFQTRAFANAKSIDLAWLESLQVQGFDILVQEFVHSVDREYGEHAIVCVDGKPSHAVRKSLRLAGDEESTSEVDITEDEVQFVHRVLDACPFDARGLLYARVDVAKNENDQLVLMELELIEPSLFLVKCEGAMNRFVQAIQARL